MEKLQFEFMPLTFPSSCLDFSGVFDSNSDQDFLDTSNNANVNGSDLSIFDNFFESDTPNSSFCSESLIDDSVKSLSVSDDCSIYSLYQPLEHKDFYQTVNPLEVFDSKILTTKAMPLSDQWQQDCEQQIQPYTPSMLVPTCSSNLNWLADDNQEGMLENSKFDPNSISNTTFKLSFTYEYSNKIAKSLSINNSSSQRKIFKRERRTKRAISETYLDKVAKFNETASSSNKVTPVVATIRKSKSTSFQPPCLEDVETLQYFKPSSFSNSRIKEINRLAISRKVDLVELKNLTDLFSGAIDNDFSLSSRIKIICLLCELIDPIKPGNLEGVDIFKRFHIIENEASRPMIQVKTSCCINSNFVTPQYWLHKYKDFEIKLFAHFKKFTVFKAFDNPGLKQTRTGKIKRPLNSYMLYRSTMIKAAVILSILHTIPVLLREYHQYFNSLIAPFAKLKYSDNVMCELILKDLEYFHQINEYDTMALLKDWFFKKHLIINNMEKLEEKIGVNDRFINSKFFFFKNYDVENKFFNAAKVNHSTMCQTTALLWLTEPPKIKEFFAKFSEIEKLAHTIAYPDYKFSPKKKRNTKDDSFEI